MVICSVASVCVSVSVYNALSFERLDLESSFLACRYTFRIFRSSSYIKVIGSRSRSQEQKCVGIVTVLLAGGLPLFERQSCWLECVVSTWGEGLQLY